MSVLMKSNRLSATTGNFSYENRTSSRTNCESRTNSSRTNSTKVE